MTLGGNYPGPPPAKAVRTGNANTFLFFVLLSLICVFRFGAIFLRFFVFFFLVVF